MINPRELQFNPVGTGSYTSGPNGKTDTLVVLVPNLSTDPFEERIRVAEYPGLPEKGDPHPYDPSMVLNSIEVNSYGSNRDYRQVRLRYETPSEGDAIDASEKFGPVRWSRSVRFFTKTTKRNIDGELLFVRYQGVPQLEFASANTAETFTGTTGVGQQASRTVTAEVDVPLIQLVGSRFEREDPEPRLFDFGEPRVNQEQFRVYPPFSVLYQGAFSRERQDGSGFDVDYTFTVNVEDGWRVEASILISGQVPIDAVLGNGIELHDVYRPASFSRLEL